MYRKLEARGEIRGGRFASGFSVSVSGADSLNLAGILTPGPKLPALAGNRVLYRDGMPIAFLEGDSKFLEVVEPEIESLARLALYGHPANQTVYAIEAVRAAAEKSRRPAVIDGSCPIYDR